MSKVWTADEIKDILKTNDAALERGVLRIYTFQTATEQACHTTMKSNGIGFNACDADFLTSIAKWLKQSGRPEGRKLSPRQLAAARKAMLKYAGQLARFANGDIHINDV